MFKCKFFVIFVNCVSKNIKIQVPKFSKVFFIALLTLAFCVLSTNNLSAQNDCLSATVATVNLSGTGCSPQTAVLGTPDPLNPIGSTAPCSITQTVERWIKFTAIAPTATVNITSSSIPATQRELAVIVYSGTCGSLTQIACANNTLGVAPQTESLTLTGLVYNPPTDYYIRIINEGTATTFNTTSCISSTPANDEPAGSFTLSINNTSTVCASTSANNYFATSTNCSPSIPNPSCPSYTPGVSQDVWYSVTVPPSGNLIVNSSAGPVALALYSGTNSPGCGSMTQILCTENGSSVTPALAGFNVSGLAPGVYYIRAWRRGSGVAVPFSLCATSEPITPPVNDNPCGATTAVVSAGVPCTTTNTTSLLGATPTLPVPSCAGLPSNVQFTDVWTQFTATANTHSISVTATNPATVPDRRIYMAVYSTTTSPCSPSPIGSEILCSSNTASTVPVGYNLSGLTIGQTYLIRFFNYSAAGYSTTISYCITSPTPPPNNNECTGAVAITPAAGTACGTSTTGTVFGQTASFQTNGCAVGAPTNDVWYSFVASSTSHSVTLTNASGVDFYHSVFAGTCGSLGPAIICGDPNSSIIYGLTVGNTYFVRVYASNTPVAITAATGTFVICVNTPTTDVNCFTPSGSNDFCPNPTSLSQSPYTFTGTVGAPPVAGGIYTSDVPGNLGSVFGGSIESNAWYSFIAVTPTHTFNIVPAAPTCTVQARVFNVTTVGTCCVSFTTMSNFYSSTGSGLVTAVGLTPGNTYLLMIDGASASNCTYSINTWVLTSLLPVEYVSFTGDSEGKKNVLKWTTASESSNVIFNLEHSKDGADFQTIYTINGKGNGSLTNYEAYDEDPYDDVTYYRLRQNEKSETKYSNIISVNLKNKYDAVFNIHPNPTSNYISFDYYTKTNDNLLIEILSYTGCTALKTEYFIEEGKNNIAVPINNLPNGIYILKVSSEKSKTTSHHKIIKN